MRPEPRTSQINLDQESICASQARTERRPPIVLLCTGKTDSRAVQERIELTKIQIILYCSGWSVNEFLSKQSTAIQLRRTFRISFMVQPQSLDAIHSRAASKICQARGDVKPPLTAPEAGHCHSGGRSRFGS